MQAPDALFVTQLLEAIQKVHLHDQWWSLGGWGGEMALGGSPPSFLFFKKYKNKNKNKKNPKRE